MESSDILRSERKALLQRVDRDELEGMDQLVEISALGATLILGVVIYFSDMSMIPIFESINLVITFTIYLAYKIARIKLAVDLRLWIISEVVTLAIFIIMVNLVFLTGIIGFLLLVYTVNVQNEIFRWLSLLGLCGCVFLILYVWARVVGVFPHSESEIPFGQNIAIKRWEKLIDLDESASSYPDEGMYALYLVLGAKLGYPAYIFAFVALVLMGIFPNIGMVGSIENLAIIICLGIVLLYSIFKMKKAQKEELHRLTTH